MKTTPIPALALSNALLFANPTFDCLSSLGQEQDRWQDAVVLSTPFWLPRVGKLHKLLTINNDVISPLVAASIRFDPDRELTIATDGFSPDAVINNTTKNALAMARRVRVLDRSTEPLELMPSITVVRLLPLSTDLLRLMPSLTAVHLATAEQLIACKTALASLEGLRELRVTNCRELTDLSAIVTLPALHKLSLGCCFNLQDVSALASLTSLQKLSLYGCPPEADLSVVDKLPALRTRHIDHSVHDPWGYGENTMPDQVPVDLLSTYTDFLRSDDPEENIHGALMIRMMLTVDFNPPVDKVIDHGCLPLFVAQLLRDEFPQLQFDSAWALTNVASGDSGCATSVLDIPRAVPNLVRLLGSPDEGCRDHAAGAIGNLAGEGAAVRDVCLHEGALPGVIAVITAAGQKASTTRNAAWALSNLCRNKPLPQHEQVAPALPVFVELLNHEDDELIVDAASALSYLSDGGENDRIQRVLDTGCLPRLVELLGAEKSAIITPAILAVGSIVGGDERQTQAVIDAGALQAFHPLINHPNRAIRKEVCWTISNITAGTQDQIQAVIDANIIPALMNATKDSQIVVRKEAAWAIANATSVGSPAQIDDLVRLGVLPCLCDLLSDHPKIVADALEALDNILDVGAREHEKSEQVCNHHADEVVSCGGKDRLVALQDHVDNKIKEHAAFILKEYWQHAGNACDGSGPS